MYGGGQKVALDLLDGLEASNDVKAELWLLGCRHEALRKRASFIADYGGDYSSPATVLAAAGLVRARLAASNVHIVHSHGWDADIIAYLAALGRPEARVIHLHVTPRWIFSQSIQHRARRLMTGRMFAGDRTRVLAVANAVSAHWARAFDDLTDNTQVVYNSADPVRFCPAPKQAVRIENKLTIGVTCRLAPQKGLAVLLRALPGVLRNSPGEISLKIAGEGPEREHLERLAKELNVAHLVEFLGHVDDVERLYRALDVLVLPAISDEGMPLAILEAMASGLPVITTDIGGSGEVVRHDVDGFVVEPNSPTALSTALVALLASSSKRLEMGRSALDRVRETFSPSLQVDAVTKVYAGLVEHASSPVRQARAKCAT